MFSFFDRYICSPRQMYKNRKSQSVEELITFERELRVMQLSHDHCSAQLLAEGTN
jgi:hypothetical protein